MLPHFENITGETHPDEETESDTIPAAWNPAAFRLYLHTKSRFSVTSLCLYVIKRARNCHFFVIVVFQGINPLTQAKPFPVILDWVSGKLVIVANCRQLEYGSMADVVVVVVVPRKCSVLLPIWYDFC